MSSLEGLADIGHPASPWLIWKLPSREREDALSKKDWARGGGQCCPNLILCGVAVADTD